MKYLLLKVTAFAWAATSGVYAHEEPSSSLLRGAEHTDTIDVSVTESIDCIGPNNKLDQGIPLPQACAQQQSAYKVPYVCSKGQQLCCTRSNIRETDFGKPGVYGECVKLFGPTDKDA